MTYLLSAVKLLAEAAEGGGFNPQGPLVIPIPALGENFHITESVVVQWIGMVVLLIVLLTL